MKKHLTIIILLLLSHGLFAQYNALEPAIIPFNLTSHNNISLEAIIGEADTLDLMFHTAAGSLALTSKATAKMKSIKWSKESEAQSWGGKATTRYSENNKIQIGPLIWENETFWEDENSGPNTGGKFGPNLFEGYAIEIDYEKSQIKLHKSLPTLLEIFVKTPLIVENGMWFIEGTCTINDVVYKNRFLIHSGYGSALLFDDAFVAESKIGEQIEITDQKELKDSFGNVIKVNKGTLPSFSMGEIELTDIPVGFFEGKIGRQKMSILGGDILKRFHIIIDEKRENIYLKKSQFAETAYTEF